jgi:hypothetical protein
MPGFARRFRSENHLPPFSWKKRWSQNSSHSNAPLEWPAHAQQAVIKGGLIHCGVQSISIKLTALRISVCIQNVIALCQNTAGAVFRPLNQQDYQGAKGEIRRSTFS